MHYISSGGHEEGGGGSGDVVGPASSTDNDLALFDGVTGKLLKDGGSLAAAAAIGGLGAGGAIAASDLLAIWQGADPNKKVAWSALCDAFAFSAAAVLFKPWGATSSFPALARSSADLKAVLADGSGYTNLHAGQLSGWVSRFYKNAFTTYPAGSDTNNPSVTIDANNTGIGFAQNANGIRFSSNNNSENSLDSGLTRSAAGTLSIDGGTVRDGLGKLVIGSGRCVGRTSSAAGASTTELTTDKDWSLHKNTTTGVVSLAYNDGGTIKNAALA
jgi:hypothetical protein